MHVARPLAATAALAAALTGGLVAGAAPASALSPCAGYDPPEWCFSPPPGPAAPTALKASAVLQTQVSLSWTHGSTAAREAYHVTRTVDGLRTTVDLTGSATSYTDSSAPAGTRVTYSVHASACNLYGCTDGAATSLTVTTRPSPASPVGTAYGWSTRSWNGSEVYYSMSGWAIDWDTTAPIDVVLLSDGVVSGGPVKAQAAASTNSANPGYGDNHGFTLSWLRKSPVKGTHTSCVKAVNVAGGRDAILGCFSYVTPGAPSPATSVTAARSGSSVTVGFTDAANDETGWFLQRSTDGGATWLQVGAQQPAVAGVGKRSSVLDYSTVAAGTCYRILMVNSYGQTPSAPGCTA